jgi:nonribosomal peptide synthetase MxcG
MIDAHELTQAQLGIWFGHQRASDPALFNAAEIVLVEGELEVAGFEQALTLTLAEAGALNVAFVEDQGVPRVVPVPFAGARLEIVHRPDLATDAALTAHVDALARLPLAIERGQLWRHQLVVVGPRTHAWVHVAHHVALDGFGFQLVARRVAAHYQAIHRGADVVGLGFTELDRVLAEERAYLADGETADRAFWANELGGRRGVALAPVQDIGRAARLPYALDAGLVRALDAASLQAGVTWAESAIAVVAAHLGARTGARSPVLGLPVSLRLGRAALRTPCTAMNIAPLPIDLDAADSVADLANAVRTSLARQRRHQRYRHEQLRRDRPGVDRRFGPIINVLPFEQPTRFGDATARVIRVTAGPVEDVAIGIAREAAGLAITIDRRADAHTAAFSDALAGAIADDLRAFAADPSRRLPRPTVTTPPAPLPPVWPPAALERHAAATPGAIAVQDGDRLWTYAGLHAQVRAFAAAIRARGCGPGDLIAIEASRSGRAIIALLGALHAGAGYVVLDPGHPLERRRAMIQASRPRLLVRDDVTAEPLGDAPVASLAALAEAPLADDGPAPAIPGDQLAYVVFTSGSTGEPKGVAVGSRALAGFLAAAIATYRWSAADRVLQFAPLTFDASVEEVFASLSVGATLVVRDDRWLESPEAFFAACARERISVLDLPTAYWHELALAVIERGLAVPASIATIIIGGEAAAPARVQGWKARAPGPRLVNTYGPTETTVVALAADLDGLDGLGAEVPIGRPLPGVGAVVRDRDGAIATEGELWLLGPTLADGYLGRDDLTAARFAELPGLGRAYRTGDLVATRDDGQLVYRGRVDDEIKIAGYRIAPAEVEAALARHPRVVHAVVWGEPSVAGHRLCARVEASEVTAGELRTFVARWLPAPMVPASLEVHAALPRATSGKLDRRRVQAMARSAPVAVAMSSTETQVVAVWRAVLGIDEVGLDDDFFALGGDSLGVIKLANRLSAVGAEVRVADVFRHPTPRGLARRLDDPAPARSAFVPRPIELPDPLVRATATAEAHGRILLTGASGLVGIHLLRALLDRHPGVVTCLVRADGDAAAHDRLLATAARWGVDLAPVVDRIEAVAADLVTPALAAGLAARVRPCAVIVHAAAQVSLVRDYASLAAANVVATAELIALAGTWGAALHHVSSVAVAPAGPEVPERFVAVHDGLRDGYQQSKWHAEALCEEAAARGLSVAVHRLGRVTGSRATPFVVTSDLVWRVARTAVRIDAWPDLAVDEPWIPADEAAAAMAALVASAATGVFHLTHAGTVSLTRVGDALGAVGFRLERLPLPAWLDRAHAGADDEDRATLAFFDGRGDAAPAATSFAATRTRAAVPTIPAGVDDDLLIAYARAFQRALTGGPPLRATAASDS